MDQELKGAILNHVRFLTLNLDYQSLPKDIHEVMLRISGKSCGGTPI
jgi:hypothetical protein